MSSLDKAIGLTRRSALLALAGGAVGFAAWPYRPRGSRSIPRGRVVLTYWEKWTGRERAAMQRIVDWFNESQDRIWVRQVSVSDIVPKAMVAISGGDPPDVIGLFNYSIPHFAEAGAIFPLDDFGGLEQSSYAPAVWDLLTFDGQCWAGVNTCYNIALYYNRTLFHEGGLDPDKPPRTVAELDACAQQLTTYGDDGRIERAGFMPNIPDWWPYFWPVMFGGAFYDPASNRATLMARENLDAYDWVASYPKNLGRLAVQGFGEGFAKSYHSPQDPFLTGRVAMVAQGPWIANFIREAFPTPAKSTTGDGARPTSGGGGFDYGCAPIPVTESLYDPDKPRGLLEADVLMIPRHCPHPAEAFEFVQFTQRVEVQEALASDHCKPSPMRSVSDSFVRNHPNRYVAVHDAITKSPVVTTPPKIRVWRQYTRMIGSAFDAIWAGDDPVVALQVVQDRVQQLLEIGAERRALRRGLRRAARR